MSKKILILVIALVLSGLFPLTIPVFAEIGSADFSSSLQRSRRFGPYATIRRANEVANTARRRGYKAKVIYGWYMGTRMYYVDVWR